MEVKCEYCGSMIPESAEKCPNCGGTNDNFKRSTDGTPRTIEELKKWYVDRKLPPEEVTRFFIGKDIKEPKAFGIYQDGENFIVYKNKDTGERAIRYNGKDEAYAVNELYLKLKSEILNQKAHSHSSGPKRSKASAHGSTLRAVLLFVAIIVLGGMVGNCGHGHDGYYNINNTLFYNYGNSWYYYDSIYDDYYYSSDPGIGNSELDSYRVDDSYYYGTEYDFKDSTAWSDIQSSSSDSDYNWDSSYDSWDSGSSDWGSDW